MLVYGESDFQHDRILADLSRLVPNIADFSSVSLALFTRLWEDVEPCFFTTVLPEGYPALVFCAVFRRVDSWSVGSQARTSTYTLERVGWRVFTSNEEALPHVQVSSDALYRSPHVLGNLEVYPQEVTRLSSSGVVEFSPRPVSPLRSTGEDSLGPMDEEDVKTNQTSRSTSAQLEIDQVRHATLLWIQAYFTNEASMTTSLQSLSYTRPLVNLSSQVVVVASFALCGIPVDGLVSLMQDSTLKPPTTRAIPYNELVDRAIELYTVDSNGTVRLKSGYATQASFDCSFVNMMSDCIRSIRWQQSASKMENE